MPIEVRLPELGENVTSGQVVRVMVAVGDRVEKGQSILELETDKAAIEVPTSAAGVVKAVHFQMGDVVKVDQLLLTLDAEGADAAATLAEAAAAPPAKPAKNPKAAPAPAPTAQPPAPPAPSPAPAASPEPVAQPKAEPRPPKLVVVPPPSMSTRAQPAPAAPASAAIRAEAPAAPAEPALESQIPGRLVPAAPSVRRLAHELGLDVNRVPGSGPGGRVSLEDVKAHARTLLSGGGTKAAPEVSNERAPGSGGPPLPDFTEWGEVERRSMSNVRRLTAERMSRAWSVIPQVTHFDRADVTELEELRRRFVESHKASGTRLTLTPIILKAASIALGELPQLNASIDMEAQEVVLKKYRHIAVAVDTDRGLLAPVVRDVDRKGILALAREVDDLAKRAREKKIQVAERRGATFTVTNLGGIGGTGFSPIVNHPEVAVLGVARGDWVPRLRDGVFVPRLMLPLALSYDHRLVDGADGARFVKRVAALLEDPLSWMLEGG